jgi:hypothetical protein
VKQHQESGVRSTQVKSRSQARPRENSMRGILTPVTAALALAVITFVPTTGARAGGPPGATQITTCRTISQSGPYVLANNLSATGNCLVITANSVTIDLAGFSIVGSGTSTGIVTTVAVENTVVRNGSISNFNVGVDLSNSSSSIVEGLHVFGNLGKGVGNNAGIEVNNAIVRGNSAQGNTGGTGISANGSSVVTGNLAFGNHNGILAGGTVSDNAASGNISNILVYDGSTVIGNTASEGEGGLLVSCPSNVINNTATNNQVVNLSLEGTGCNSVNNVAP